ncbi:MAG: FAD-dependent oxidoreductase [Dehalococcoidia bacterium]
MAEKLKRLEADVIIAGGGPGGCGIAKDLSKTGKKVILVEKGGYFRRYAGTPIVWMKFLEGGGRYLTQEGDVILQGLGVGGGTLLFAGSADEPDHDLWRKYGVDITQETKEARKECRVNKVPDSLISPGIRRLVTAANDLGYPWEARDRFFDPDKCKLGCNQCAIGCPTGSKWTGMEFASEALRNGATILTHVAVRDIIVENGIAGGVRAFGRDGQPYEINARVVVCSAGGIGTARILKRSGIYDAGNRYRGDLEIESTGYAKFNTGRKDEILMNVGWKDKENGVLFTSAAPTRLLSIAVLLTSRRKRHDVRNLLRWGKGMSMCAVITDESEGQVFIEERFGVSHLRTKRDRQRLEYARAVNERILIKEGCDPRSIEHAEVCHIAHGGYTVQVGKLLDSNLETSIKNLYCCDLSVIPDLSTATEPTLTVMALSKRLAKHLDARLSA